MSSFFPASVSRYFQPASYNRQPSQYQQPQVQAFYQNSRQNFWTASSVGLSNQPTSWFKQLFQQTLKPFSTIWALFNRYMPQQPTNPYNPTNPATPPTKPITADGWRLPSTDFRDLTTDQRMTLTGLSSAELVSRLDGIPRKLASKPWVGILAGSNGKMISKNKTLASNLIAWYLIGDRIGAKLVNELEDGWREINGGYPLPTPKN